MDAPERHHALLSDIERHARLQNLPLTGVVAEAASGQYELNLHHSRRVLEACDQIMALKRLTRQIAEQHHQHACFMAKPCAHAAGSGLHFHISLQDEHGENLLTGAPGELSDNMQQAMAGMLALMPASMAITAPNINAFRRFRPGMHVPLRALTGPQQPHGGAAPALRRQRQPAHRIPRPAPTPTYGAGGDARRPAARAGKPPAAPANGCERQRRALAARPAGGAGAVPPQRSAARTARPGVLHPVAHLQKRRTAPLRGTGHRRRTRLDAVTTRFINLRIIMNMQPQRAPVQPLLCWRKGVFHISTDRQLLDIEAIQRFLSLPDRAAAERTVHHGLCFGLYRKRHLLGFARMVTDYATFASVSELFVSAEYRGVGLGSWLTRCCWRIRPCAACASRCPRCKRPARRWFGARPARPLLIRRPPCLVWC